MIKNIYNKGITLITLVITIVVIIILAGISFAVLLGENGIITRAIETKEIQKIAEITEKLEIEKAPVGIDNSGTVSLDNYLNHIKTKNIITDENVLPIIEGVEITEDCYILVENKYKYLLEEEENGNLKITYLGIPLILKLETDTKTNAITVKTIIEKQFQDKEKYTFYIKTNKTEEYQKVAEQEENGEYTYEGLNQGITYYIKVEVETKEGRKDSKQIAIKTEEMPDINPGDIIFNTTPIGWTNGNKQTTITTAVTGFTIQYSLDGTTWTNYTLAIANTKNGSIYARLTDGVNAGNYAVQNITTIDKIAPNNFTIASTSITTNSFVLSGTATDGAATSEYGSSGIKNYTYYFKKSTDAAYTNAVQTTTSKTYSNLSSGTYNLYVIATDNAGNPKQSNTLNVTLSSVIGISGATYTPTAWTNGNVTVTLPKTTGYTTQYQIGGISGTWLNYTNPFAITTNSTIYYRYNDGINAGNYASVNITNIDKTPPTITKIDFLEANLNGSNAKYRIRATASDANSGLETYIFNINGTANTTTNNYYDRTFTTSINDTINITVKDKAGNSKIWTETLKMTSKRAFIVQLYNKALADNRVATSAEIDQWDNTSNAQLVAGGILQSDESKNFKPTSTIQFATALYLGILGRTTTPGTTELQSKMGPDRLNEILSVVNSAEFKAICNKYGLQYKTTGDLTRAEFEAAFPQ